MPVRMNCNKIFFRSRYHCSPKNITVNLESRCKEGEEGDAICTHAGRKFSRHLGSTQ